MNEKLSRRKALKGIGSAGVVALLDAQSLTAQEAAIRIAGQPVEIVVAPVSAVTVRLSVTPIVDGQPQTLPHDGSWAQRTWSPPAARITSLTRARQVRCGDLVVKLTPDPLTIRVEAKDGRLVQQLRPDAQTGALNFMLDDKPALGFGEGGPQFDRRGSTYNNRNGQGGYPLRTHGGRVPIQWLIGTSGWALFIHHPLGSFDLTGNPGRLTPRGADRPASSVAGALESSPALPLDVFVVGAREPARIMAEYARLIGDPEMPPLWSLGYLQSHRTLDGPEEVKWVARTFREKKLPCDALIYLGTDFTPSGWNTHNGEFTFHPKNFPDPKKMIDELHDQHFKVVLHTVLEGRRLAGAVNEACAAPPLPSGRTPDGKWPDNRQVSCYWPVHKSLYDVGVDGWWPDPGDVYSTWETLKTHVPVAINTGLTGIPYWGTDIGGFVPTKEYTGELHARWFQFGAFCPLFRAHGRTWHLRLPWGWNTGELGPDEIANYTGGAANPDTSELRNPEVEPICRKYLELRYRLMPYLYSVVRESHETGLPIMRALWLHYPEDVQAVARGDQYLWGRDILVAPVTEKGAQSRQVYLPRGNWYDFWTEEKIEGGREIAKAVDLSTMPLFVREGAIIPLGPVKQYTGEKVDGPLTLQIYPGAIAAFVLYEDDGTTFNYRNGEWMGIHMTWNDSKRRLTLRLAESLRLLSPLRRRIEVRIASEKATRTIVFAGRPVKVQF